MNTRRSASLHGSTVWQSRKYSWFEVYIKRISSNQVQCPPVSHTKAQNKYTPDQIHSPPRFTLLPDSFPAQKMRKFANLRIFCAGSFSGRGWDLGARRLWWDVESALDDIWRGVTSGARCNLQQGLYMCSLCQYSVVHIHVYTCIVL